MAEVGSAVAVSVTKGEAAVDSQPAPAIAPELKKAIDKQKADKIKITLKRLLRKIDDAGAGHIKFEVFSNLLELHKVNISAKSLTKLRLMTRAKPKAGGGDSSDMIDYKQALRLIDVDLEAQDPFKSEWVLKTAVGPNSMISADTLSHVSHYTQLTGKRLDKKSETHYAMKLINKTIDERATPKKVVHKTSTPRSQTRSVTKLQNQKDEHPYTETPTTRKNEPAKSPQGTKIYDPIFARMNQPVSVFDGHRKSDLATKWDMGSTSFKTVNYDQGSIIVPKKKPTLQARRNSRDNVNLVSNQEWAVPFDNGAGEKEHRSVSLTGYKEPPHHTKPKRDEERPNPMRARIIDHYIKSVLDPKKDDELFKAVSKNFNYRRWVETVEQIYRLNLDNRILNNLREQLNQMIDDERGLVSTEVFRRMFFTFFKGEPKSYQVYEMLLPIVTVYFDDSTDQIVEETHEKATEANKCVRIQLLTQFIDLFNYYPVKVNKLRYKNDSNDVTYIMSSNTHGTKDERGLPVKQADAAEKSAEEKHLLNLLQMVSNKIRERFDSFQHCFRYLDVDHTQSITLNEFA